MRKSHRTEILDAAFRVVEARGVTALTLEAVAQEAGLTKGGLLYHFPSREALLLAIHQHLAERWREDLTRSAAAPSAELTADERLAAYIRANTLSATRTELALLLDAAGDETLSEPAMGVIADWAPPPPQTLTDQEAIRRFVARIASDGLWLYEALGQDPIPAEIREEIAEIILEKLGRI